MSKKKLLPSKTDNQSEWYTRVIQIADLADYGPAKGTMIIKPYGYAIWENVQRAMDEMIKERGVGNAYFPLFIPMSLLQKEASHVEGFSPELAVVTHGGGSELEEPLAVRPTSETIMYEAYSKWVQSWRDLPIQMNQWNNVVRWEKRTYMFMRTSEFLWQEGHTAHATHKEAIDTQKWAMDMYQKIYNDYFAIFGYVGNKSKAERFAGADTTLTFESLMPGGKALQSCTSHDLGQNFSKPFNISFQDEAGKEQYVWQTSWGFSTRSIGGLILAHGDDNGLKLPPKLAPVQVIVLPVKPDDRETVEYCNGLSEELAKSGVRVEVDARDDESMGWRINKWEVKGVPFRIEVGSKEVADQVVTTVRRDTGEKQTWSRAEAAAQTQSMLETIQSDMFAASKAFTEENTYEAKSLEEFKDTLKQHRGFIKVNWNDNSETEVKIQEETKATSRCTAPNEAGGSDFYTGEASDTTWYFAQGY